MLEASGGAQPSRAAAPRERQGALVTLVEGMQRREQESLSLLYDATIGEVHGLALRILQDAEMAEETVSDVYYQAWQKASHYEPARSPVLAWLLMMCRSRALDALRRRKPVEAEPESPSPDSNLVEAMERELDVRQCLATLGESEQQLLALAFYKGLSHSEIARERRMPLGSVKSQIRNALKKMRARIEGEER